MVYSFNATLTVFSFYFLSHLLYHYIRKIMHNCYMYAGVHDGGEHLLDIQMQR